MAKRAKKVKAAGAKRAGLPIGGIVLGQNNYGKSKVRMVKVSRAGKKHTVREISVDIALEGDFEPIHRGRNERCLPTDTMKNTVYAMGKEHALETIESFALDLGGHFMGVNQWVAAARVQVQQVPWNRVRVGGKDHPHCFTKGTEERQTCDIAMGESESYVVSGIEDLVILKSTDSAFWGYPKSRYTTLPETRDRIMASSVTAQWLLTEKGVKRGAFAKYREAVRAALIETFAEHKSESVQHTLLAMGEAALKACPEVDRIRLSMPNKHCLLVNLKAIGLKNENEIFVPTDEPYGLIEGTVERR